MEQHFYTHSRCCANSPFVVDYVQPIPLFNRLICMKANCGNKSITALYSAAHFAVDFCCAVTVFSAARSTLDGALLFLLYNFCAFALQLPLGAIIDVKGFSPIFAAVGCVLVGLGMYLGEIAAAVAAGLGNAAFHVGAGVDILKRSEGRASLLGIFVSPGAIGVFLGSLLALPAYVRFVLMPISMVVFALLLLWLCGKGEPATPSPFTLPEKGSIIAAGLLTVVLLRSLGGMAMNFSWKSGVWAFSFMLCVVLGKTFGGIVGDRLGMKRTAILSLSGAAMLVVFGDSSPVLGILAALLFNMTMPLTLHRAAQLFGEYKGTAFGLLTLGLFIGFLPSYTNFGISGGTACALLSLLSLLLLIPCLKKEEK